MKINVEIDMEDYDEGTLSEIVERRLANGIMATMKKNVTDLAVKTITDRLDSSINQWILDTLNSFIDRPIMITDNYGSEKATYANVTEMLKERFDNFMTDAVDSRGNPLNRACSSYDNSRMKFLVDKRIEDHVKTLVEQITKTVDAKIKNALTAELKAQLSEKLLSNIDMADALRSVKP